MLGAIGSQSLNSTIIAISNFMMIYAYVVAMATLFNWFYVNVAELVGQVTVNEFGKNVTRYVVSTNASMASVSGSTISLQHNGQIQIAANSSDSYSSDMFARYYLNVCAIN